MLGRITQRQDFSEQLILFDHLKKKINRTLDNSLTLSSIILLIIMGRGGWVVGSVASVRKVADLNLTQVAS